MKPTLETELEAAIRAFERLQKSSAIRTRQMIGRYGYLEACSKLMCSPDIQTGFKTLVAAGLADHTF